MISISADSDSGDLVCDVVVSQGNGAEATLADAFTYKTSLTPTVTNISKNRGKYITGKKEKFC